MELESLAGTETGVSGLLLEVKEYHAKSLFHEMTLSALKAAPGLSPEGKEAFWGFLSEKLGRINPLSAALLAVQCAPQSPEAGRKFLLERAEATDHKEAEMLIRAEMAARCIQMGEQKEARELLRSCEAFLKENEANDITNEFSRSFFRAKAELNLHLEEYTVFYQSALRYLVHEDLSALTDEKKQSLAFDIGVAALVGDKVFNFGELLGHPLTQSLQGSDREWLLAILSSFNTGNLKGYEEAAQQNAAKLNAIPPVAARPEFLKLKLQIMALLQFLFQMEQEQMIVSFDQVESACRIETQKVEVLLLKAMAVGVIKGSIDQMGKNCTINWVQPRVLDRAETAQLAEKIGQWRGRVKEQYAKTLQPCDE